MSELITLANGGELNADSWADFVKRLHDDVRGNRVNDHCTADAIFDVQELHTVYGIDLDYTDDKAVYFNDDSAPVFKDPDDWFSYFDEKERLKIISELENDWSSMSVPEKWDFIDGQDGWTVTGYKTEYRHICSHLTYAAAEAFIQRKKHAYEQLRIYTDSRYWCWEFITIINGILDGKIALADKSEVRT